MEEWLGSTIGAGVGLAGQIWGGIRASQAMRGVKKNIKAQRRENEDWYNRRYNEDATQRADAQRMLTQTMEAMRSQNRNAAATAAVMGGTEESVAAQKEASAQAMADTAAQITANAAAQKDAIEAEYRQKDAELQGQLNNMRMQQAGSIAQAAQGVGQAGSSWSGLF